MSINKSGRSIVILGAGAGMARPFIRLLFKQWQQCTFYLLARNLEAIQDLAEEGKAKGHTVSLIHYDLEQPTPMQLSGVEFCITYAGWLPPDNNEPEKAMLLNCTGIEEFVNELVEYNQQSLKGILITGSIAGVRVRPANRSYGLAKQALHTYTLALQKKWAGKIAVTLVIPGYVQTKMLAGVSTPAALTLSPEKLAEKYVTWLEQKPKVVYSQPAWRIIGMILKMAPQFLIDKMKK